MLPEPSFRRPLPTYTAYLIRFVSAARLRLLEMKMRFALARLEGPLRYGLTVLSEYLAERNPFWAVALSRTNLRAAIILASMRRLLRTMFRSRLGRMLDFIRVKTLWLLAKRYRWAYDFLEEIFEEIRMYYIESLLLMYDYARKRFGVEIRPIAYIEFIPKTLQPATMYLISRDLKELSITEAEEVTRCLLELAAGKISLEEAIQRYPSLERFLRDLSIDLDEILTGRKTLIFTPVVERMLPKDIDGLRVFFYMVVADAGSRLSDPELAASFAHDLHISYFRFKSRWERVTEIGFPVPEEYLGFPNDVLERELTEVPVENLLFDTPFLKSWIATIWGKPEEWWRIDIAEPRFTVSNVLLELGRAVIFRRKLSYQLARTLIQYWGLR